MTDTAAGRRIAVVLFNLGGPDDQASVKPFLFNLFNDPAIIGLPPAAGSVRRRRTTPAWEAARPCCRRPGARPRP